MLRYIFHILTLIVASQTAILSDYFQKCSLLDPKLNRCLTKIAIDAWPIMVKGDLSVHLQPLDPLHVLFLHFPVSDAFKGNTSNVNISGLADMKINDIMLDSDKKNFDIYFFVPRLVFFGQYDVAGELISIPVYGKGTANNTIFNMENHLHIEYELIEKNGKHYIEVIKNSMVYKTSKINFQMDQLGYILNQIFNENWEAVNNEIKTVLGNVLGATFTEILKQMFVKVSFEDLFSN